MTFNPLQKAIAVEGDMRLLAHPAVDMPCTTRQRIELAGAIEILGVSRVRETIRRVAFDAADFMEQAEARGAMAVSIDDLPALVLNELADVVSKEVSE